MHRATLLPVIIIAAVVVGGLLYLYGGPAFHQSYRTTTSGTNSIFSNTSNLTVLADGTNAVGINQRVNYRVTDPDQLAALWQTIYTDNGTQPPNVDFSTYEVLALFDGSHTTGGYGIKVESVKDTGGKRVVTITHIVPGDSCVPAGGITSPFIIVQVPKSTLPIARVEQTTTTQCQ